jgi:hypothetical protein
MIAVFLAMWVHVLSAGTGENGCVMPARQLIRRRSDENREFRNR